MMPLIADRFLELSTGSTIDCATAQEVDLAIDRAGDRAEQQRWTETCARSLVDPRSRIIDFGFIGSDRRFIASARTMRPPIAQIETVCHAVEWLEHSNHASPATIRSQCDTGAEPMLMSASAAISRNGRTTTAMLCFRT